MIPINNKCEISQKANILLDSINNSSGGLWNCLPIIYLCNQELCAGGIMEKSYSKNGMAVGDFYLRFSDDRVINIPNVHGFSLGFNNKGRYKATKRNFDVFDENELYYLDFYIVQVIDDTSKCNNFKLLLYTGPDLIDSISNICKSINIFEKMKFGYTIKEFDNEGYYSHVLYDNGKIKTIAKSKQDVFIKEYYLQKEEVIRQASLAADWKSKVHIYFHNNGTKSSLVFKEFCKKADELQKMKNFLPDDDTQNYHVTFSSDRLDDIAFAEYCIMKGKFGGLAIYNYPLQSYLSAITPSEYPMLSESWLYSEQQIKSFKDILVNVFTQLGESYSSDNLPSSFPKKEYTHSIQHSILEKWLFEKHPAYTDSLYQPEMSYDENKKEIRSLHEYLREKYIEIAQQLTLSGELKIKWISEYTLFKMIIKEYPDAIYQYRAEWLGQQSLDVYIPSLNIGIEYQGEQHYRAIDFLGGEEALRNRQLLDERKRELCANNNTGLIEWRYDEPITKLNLKKKIENI